MTEDEAKVTTEAAEKPARSRSKKKDSTPADGYAIVETGGKQYRVKVGDRISRRAPSRRSRQRHFVRSRPAPRRNGATTVGAPVVDGASVSAHIEDHFRGEKIYVFKYKAKKRYRRKIGHRQELTELTITGINA